jgi:hypothetical protein
MVAQQNEKDVFFLICTNLNLKKYSKNVLIFSALAAGGLLQLCTGKTNHRK